MSENSISPFDDVDQNMQELSGLPLANQLREKQSTDCGVRRSFIQDVEEAVCAKINEIIFFNHKKGLRINIEPNDLNSRRQDQPFALARHFCNFILYNHPFSASSYSAPALGRIYRRDHTTILCSISRASAFVEKRHPFGFHLQDIVNALEPSYGPFDVFAFCNVETPVNRPSEIITRDELRGFLLAARRRQERNRIRRDLQIHQSRKGGATNAQIAKKFRIQPNSVRRIVRRVEADPEKYGLVTEGD